VHGQRAEEDAMATVYRRALRNVKRRWRPIKRGDLSRLALADGRNKEHGRAFIFRKS
jgi:hypothetical protein